MGTRELFAKRAATRERGTVELGGEVVTVQALTYAERAEIGRMFRDEDDKDLGPDSVAKRQAVFVARSVITADGLAVFSDSEADLKLILSLPASDMELLDRVIMRLNFPPAELAKN